MYPFLLLYVKHSVSKFRSNWRRGANSLKFEKTICLQSTTVFKEHVTADSEKIQVYISSSSINFPALLSIILISWVVLLLG